MDVAHTGPHGLALDEATGHLFVACDSGDLVVLDRDTGAALATVPIAGPPDVLWFDPRHQRLHVAIGTPGVVQVLDTHAMTIAEEIRTEQGAHTLTFDDSRQWLYIFLPRSNRAVVYEDRSPAAPALAGGTSALCGGAPGTPVAGAALTQGPHGSVTW